MKKVGEICELSELYIPWILFLVVWAFGETIDTFFFNMVFNKVDFPTFGRPIIETKPDFILTSL